MKFNIKYITFSALLCAFEHLREGHHTLRLLLHVLRHAPRRDHSIPDDFAEDVEIALDVIRIVRVVGSVCCSDQLVPNEAQRHLFGCYGCSDDR